MKNLMPKAWTTAAIKQKVVAKIKTEARIDMSEEVAGAGLCPDCRRPMERAMANGIDSYVCHSDRISIPVPDSMIGGQEVSAVFGPSTSEPLL